MQQWFYHIRVDDMLWVGTGMVMVGTLADALVVVRWPVLVLFTTVQVSQLYFVAGYLA